MAKLQPETPILRDSTMLAEDDTPTTVSKPKLLEVSPIKDAEAPMELTHFSPKQPMLVSPIQKDAKVQKENIFEPGYSSLEESKICSVSSKIDIVHEECDICIKGKFDISQATTVVQSEICKVDIESCECKDQNKYQNKHNEKSMKRRQERKRKKLRKKQLREKVVQESKEDKPDEADKVKKETVNPREGGTDEQEEITFTLKLEKESQSFYSEDIKVTESKDVEMWDEDFKAALHRWNLIRKPTTAKGVSQTEPTLDHPIKESVDIVKELTLTPISTELSTQSVQPFSSEDNQVINVEMRNMQFNAKLSKWNLAMKSNKDSMISHKIESSVDSTRDTDKSGIKSESTMNEVKSLDESAAKANISDEIRNKDILPCAAEIHLENPTSKMTEDKKEQQIKTHDTFTKVTNTVNSVDINIAQESTTVLQSAPADPSSENCDSTVTHAQSYIIETKQKNNQTSQKKSKRKNWKRKIEDEKYSMDDSKFKVVTSEENIARTLADEKNEIYNTPGPSWRPDSPLIGATCKSDTAIKETDVEYNVNFYSSTFPEVLDGTTTTDELGINLSTIGSSMEDPTWKRARKAMRNYNSKISCLYDWSCMIIDLLDCKKFERRRNRTKIHSLYLKIQHGLETLRRFEYFFHDRFTELPYPSLFCSVHASQLRNLDSMLKMIPKAYEVALEFLELKSKNPAKSATEADFRDDILLHSADKRYVKNPTCSGTGDTIGDNKRRQTKKSCTITKAQETLKSDDVALPEILEAVYKNEWICETPSSISSISTITKSNLPENCGEKNLTQIVDLSSEICDTSVAHKQPYNILETKQGSDQASKKKSKFRNRKRKNKIKDEKTPNPSGRPESPVIGAMHELEVVETLTVETDIKYNAGLHSYSLPELSNEATRDELSTNLSTLGSSMELPAWKKAETALENYNSKINCLHKWSNTIVDLLNCRKCERHRNRREINTLYLNIQHELETVSKLKDIFHQQFSKLPYPNLFASVHEIQLIGIESMSKVIHKTCEVATEFLSLLAKSALLH